MIFRQQDINPIYDIKIKQAREKNIRNLFDEDDTKKKVHNFAERFDIDESLVWKRMNDDMAFASTFAKDPSKQSMHQHIAAEYISQLPTVMNFEELPAGGQNAKYCVNGKIRTGGNYKKEKIKSIDFYWEYVFNNKVLRFYATHKHTGDEGGAQDNQFNDVLSFHENAKKCNDPNIVLLSITDGAYYKVKYKKEAGDRDITRIEFFNQECCGERSFATTSNGLLRKIIPIIERWLNDNFDSDDIGVEQMRLAAIYKGALPD